MTQNEALSRIEKTITGKYGYLSGKQTRAIESALRGVRDSAWADGYRMALEIAAAAEAKMRNLADALAAMVEAGRHDPR